MLTTVTKIWILIKAIKLERYAIYKNEHSMNYLSNKNEIRMSISEMKNETRMSMLGMRMKLG